MNRIMCSVLACAAAAVPSGLADVITTSSGFPGSDALGTNPKIMPKASNKTRSLWNNTVFMGTFFR